MPYRVPRVQVVPQPDDQVSFQVEGQERLRWHAARRYPRPFFFPLIGPSGRSVTRLGHPAAPDHEHHRSVWFGHRDVGGVNFWEERGGSQQIRQDNWVHYQEGGDEAGMVVQLGWFDAHKVRLLRQELSAVFRPLAKGETWLELQMRFVPELDELKLGKTNFGFLGLRVAQSLSAHYGGGLLRNSAGDKGEPALFAKPALWVDYSGPCTADLHEGLTCFDHPGNPRHPTRWHVRDDGWLSPAFTLQDAYELRKDKPLLLRYGLHVHRDVLDPERAAERAQAFAASSPWEVVTAKTPWRKSLRRQEK